MSRKDLITFLLVGIWAVFNLFILENIAKTSEEIISLFTTSTAIFLSGLIVLLILRATIKKFRKWIDTWIF